MNTIQTLLGEVLLVLANLAVVLLALIFILGEVSLIVYLAGRLPERWREAARDPMSGPGAERSPNEPGG